MDPVARIADGNTPSSALTVDPTVPASPTLHAVDQTGGRITDMVRAGAIDETTIRPARKVYPSLVQIARYDLSTTPPTMLQLGSSTGAPLGDPGPHPPPPNPPPTPTFGIALRNELGGGEIMDTQTVRLLHAGPTTQNGGVNAVVGTMGGKVLLLSGTNASILAQSEDYGIGGIALAVADLDGDADEEIVFASLFSAVEPSDANKKKFRGRMRSHVRVLDVDGTTKLKELPGGNPAPPPPRAIGDPYATNHDLAGFGACGIAVADLSSPPDGVPEILVTTAHGELVVFPWNPSTRRIGPPLYARILEGALGAFNSIQVADLFPPFGKPEVYIAGSYGIRRFDVP